MSRTRFRHNRARRHQRTRRLVRRAAIAGLLILAALPLTAQTPGRGTAAVIPIKKEITDITTRSLERRVEQALADGAKTIIFEMHTPGGMVTSALDICTIIKRLPDDVRSVAWVHNEAYSAGAMISVACQSIYMSRASKIGDCAPIMVTPTGGLESLAPAERAKAESPVLQEFRDSANRNGYDPMLCRAMVSFGQVVWWIENSESGERKFVGDDEKKTLIDDVDDESRTWKLVEKYRDPLKDSDVNAIQPIDRDDTLLTLSQSEAVGFGFAAGIADDLESLRSQLQLDVLPTYHQISGWEAFAMWLNSPLVRGALFMIVVIGGYIEFQSPGLIIPGSVAAVALVIFLAAPYVAGLANIWHLVLLGLGVILLGVEIFVLPGFGIAGLMGVSLILVAFVATFVPAEPESPFFSLPNMQGTWDALLRGVKVMVFSLLAAFVGILFLMRYLPDSWFGRRLILHNPDAASLAIREAHPNAALVGDFGVVTGRLRPGGQARFGSEIVDVQSQGEYVESGARVQVVRREGMNIFVRRLPDQQA